MQVISVNVGQPRNVEWRGQIVQTSIFKEPVEGRLRVGRLNIEGDQQSDLTVHGGAGKAVYVYPAEHYPFWRQELPDADLPWGAFGENLTTAGLSEEDVHIGDQFGIGSAEFEVTQTDDSFRPRRHDQAIPAQRPERLLSRRDEGGRDCGRRRDLRDPPPS